MDCLLDLFLLSVNEYLIRDEPLLTTIMVDPGYDIDWFCVDFVIAENLQSWLADRKVEKFDNVYKERFCSWDHYVYVYVYLFKITCKEPWSGIWIIPVYNVYVTALFQIMRTAASGDTA